MYVFGGKTKNHNYSYLADVEIYNTEDHTWTAPLLNTHSTLPLRKNHVADLIGHQMIVHGGISENNEYLGDTYLLSLSPTTKWYTCHISDEVPGPVLAGHSCCLVLPHDIKYNPRLNIYKYPDVGIGRNNSRVQIYI